LVAYTGGRRKEKRKAIAGTGDDYGTNSFYEK
jgi:hypothetical protein